jgi:tetratricopeptide (TPR) repeat protein
MVSPIPNHCYLFLNPPRIISLCILSVCAVLGLSGSVFSQTLGSQDQDNPARSAEQSEIYDRCLVEARRDPEIAYAKALSWLEVGGGLPARHCAAVAMVGMGDHAEAATRLERLAEDVPAEDTVIRAGLLAQAAQAWNLTGRLDRAEEIQTRLLGLFPNDPQLRVDRALVRMQAGRTWEAVDDLNISLSAEPDNPEVLLFRAAAYRYLDAMELARSDVDRALEIDPKRPEAWLERGILKHLDGDLEGAAQDWSEVLKLDPNGPTDNAARAHLNALPVIQK